MSDKQQLQILASGIVPRRMRVVAASHGASLEKITLAADGRTYRSTISYVAYDQSGKSTEGGGEGIGAGERMTF